MLTYGASDIRKMPTRAPQADIERIIAAGFKPVTNLVLMEALGSAPRSAGAVLAKDENCELWVSALMHVRSMLVERLARRVLDVGQDPEDRDFCRFRGHLREVEKRLPQAREAARRSRERVAAERMDRLSPLGSSPAMEMLMSNHRGELREMVRSGGAAAPQRLPDDRFDPGWAMRAGLLKRATSQAVRDLARKGGEEFEDIVGQDVRMPGGRWAELRHPLLLVQWGRALTALQHQGAMAAEVSLSPGGLLPFQTWLDMPSERGRADQRLKRMRFVEAVSERVYEQEALLQRACDEAAYAVERNRRTRERQAREQLRLQYPQEYAMHEAFT